MHITREDTMTRPHTLLVGFNEAYLRAIGGRVPDNSILVLEEPDIIRKRQLGDKPQQLPCLAAIVPAAYQQADGYLEVGCALHERHGFEAVVPGLEYAVPAAATMAERLGLRGANQRAGETLRDKYRLRQATVQAGILNPRFAEVHGPEDIAAFAADGPIVVKPAMRQASVGVQLLDHCGPEEAQAAWCSVVAADEYEQIPDRPLHWRYLAEERLRGPEYSVEALVRDGEVIFENVTEKAVIPGPHPVELGHVVPAPLKPDVQAQFADAIRALVTAIGFGTGMLHAEWILTDRGPALVECAGRCPGDRLVDLIDLAYGTRLRVTLIDLLAGRPVRLPRHPRQASAIRFLGAAPGRVVSIDGIDTAGRLPGVRELHVDACEGSEAKAWSSSWDRSGFVLVTAPDGSQARERSNAAASHVHILTV
jgi:biotin carboxylase